jgi:hypothetical protein
MKKEFIAFGKCALTLFGILFGFLALDIGVTKLGYVVRAQAPPVVNVAEGPVVVTSLAACYWPLIPPVTTPSVAECWVVGSTPALSGKYFSLGSSPTVWTPEGAAPLTGAALKSAVLAAGITVNVPAQPAATGTLQ